MDEKNKKKDILLYQTLLCSIALNPLDHIMFMIAICHKTQQLLVIGCLPVIANSRYS